MFRNSAIPAAVVSAALALAARAPMEAFAQSNAASGTRAGTKAKGRATGGGWGLGEAADPADSELAEFAKETDASLHSLHPGNVSLDVLFPVGGSPLLEGGAGARLVFPGRLAGTIAILAGVDKASEKNSFGAAFKAQRFLGTSTRAFPYVWLSGSGGKNSGDGHGKDTETKAGAGLGLGVELFVMKELSTSVEVGIASQVAPGDSFRLATATSQLALHLFVGE